MKTLDILRILAILLLAFDSFEASLIARGRSKTLKNTEDIHETSYLCLDPPNNLPPCNFKTDVNDEILDGPSRQSRSLQRLEDTEERNTETDVKHQARTVVIYKIEGCYPSRLPFILPLCKPDDTVGKIVEVRRLFPFKVMGRMAQESNISPPSVFPELDTNDWQRSMQGAWTRPIDNEDKAEVTKIISNRIVSTPQSKLTKQKRKKFYQIKSNEKKKLLDKFDKRSEEIGERKNFVKFSSTSAAKQQQQQQQTNVRASDTDSRRNRNIPWNRIDSDVSQSMKIGEISERVNDDTLLTRHRNEFPYARAIPYDAEKLRNSRLASEISYSHDNPQTLRASNVNREFSYDTLIPYDPKGIQEMKTSVTHDGAVSSFPATLSSRLIHKQVQTKFPKDSKTVSSDASMLDAAGRNKIFSYLKSLERGTSKIPDTMELTSSSVGEKMELPLKRLKMYWDEDFLATKKEIQARKEAMLMRKIIAGREYQENIIHT